MLFEVFCGMGGPIIAVIVWIRARLNIESGESVVGGARAGGCVGHLQPAECIDRSSESSSLGQP